MIFSLDVRRARKGDCLLLHFGSTDTPGLVMIDGGPKSVYRPHLRPRLMEIREARGLEAHQPLPVDLLMVSHVDDDHIQGILDFTNELREAVGSPFVRVSRFWHNSFDAIIGKNPVELTAGVAAQFGPASLEGDLPDDATIEGVDDEDPEVAESTLKVLASIVQGFRLRLDAEALEMPLNPQVSGKLIMASNQPLGVTSGLTFTVAGPMHPELLKLQKKHDDWLKELKEEGKKPEDVLSAFVDRSVPNLSSIVVLAKAGGKTMLLTGDARGDKILEGLEAINAITAGGTLHVDLLKVPHHGSSNNVAPTFFERITADHYVFSGDGEHGNPERETLAMLFDARGSKPFDLHLTYPIDEIDVERKKDWEKEQAKEEKRKANGTSSKEPREDWSPAKHSLATFFASHPLAAGQTLHVMQEEQPHVIDLLDELGF
ncbi:MAG: hypothetical protein H0W08_00715 [Acidobacteria bacterium]|nr:hypothetical protein [Acidobacteriota bacterium]